MFKLMYKKKITISLTSLEYFVYLDVYRIYLFILIPFQGHDLWAASIRDQLSFISDSASLKFADELFMLNFI